MESLILHAPLSGVVGPDSVVGTVTCYGLDGPRFKSQWRRDFPHPSRPALPASYTMGTGSLSHGLGSRGVAITTNPPLEPRFNKGYSYTCTHPLGLHGLFWGELYLLLLDITD
jgi:hypothetical protein